MVAANSSRAGSMDYDGDSVQSMCQTPGLLFVSIGMYVCMYVLLSDKNIYMYNSEFLYQWVTVRSKESSHINSIEEHHYLMEWIVVKV